MRRLLSGVLRRNRARLDHEWSSGRWRYASPVVAAQDRVTVPLIREYSHGRFLDAGCGLMPYRGMLEERVAAYDSLDLRPRRHDVTYVGDIQDMSMIGDCLYDSAMCLEVLEHVTSPVRAAGELLRVLKPGGTVVISVPHLSRLHEEPYDFWRFTTYGLETLLRDAGFEVVRIDARGGLFTFLGHQLSLPIVGLTLGIPVLGRLIYHVVAISVVRPSLFLDRVLPGSAKFAAGYAVVARRRDGASVTAAG